MNQVSEYGQFSPLFALTGLACKPRGLVLVHAQLILQHGSSCLGVLDKSLVTGKLRDDAIALFYLPLNSGNLRSEKGEEETKN